MPELVLEEIIDADSGAMEWLIALLEATFPPEECETADEIRDQVRTGRGCRCWVIREGELRVGAIRGGHVPNTEFGWIIHVALSPEARGGGRGSRAIRQWAKEREQESAQEGRAYRGTVLEVERWEDAQTDAERAFREARLEFFRRLGAVRLTPTYTQPPARPDTPPVMLNLLWLGEPGIPPATIIASFYAGAFEMEAGHPFVEMACSGIDPSDL